jgi:hypothetical protein
MDNAADRSSRTIRHFRLLLRSARQEFRNAPIQVHKTIQRLCRDLSAHRSPPHSAR